jgi:hypothetical protein
MGNLDKDQPVILMEISASSINKVPRDALVIEEPGDAWYTPMHTYLSTGILPDYKLEARRIKRRAPMFALIEQELYKRAYSRLWLKCVSEEKGLALLREAYEGLCGSHQGAKTIAHRVLRADFYWPSMRGNAKELVRRCEKCQYHSRYVNTPAYRQISISGAWPFDLWGIDLVGPFPPAAN